jgi:hypothetical protein
MMHLSTTSGQDLISHFCGEANVYQIVTVNMVKLSSSQAVFCTSKTMGIGRNSFPAQYNSGYLFLCTWI